MDKFNIDITPNAAGGFSVSFAGNDKGDGEDNDGDPQATEVGPIVRVLG